MNREVKMKLSRTSAVADYRLVQRFEAIRRRLLEARYADRWDKPVAYWALPADRRLPLAFLDRTVRDLLNTPFDRLYATPGVGRQKIAALLKLLVRAVRDTGAAAPLPIEPEEAASAEPVFEFEAGFDSDQVSEATWSRWRRHVVEHGLEDEPLGRFSPSLEHLPRVLWEAPLRNYTALSLNDIRALRTHGEKRVHGVLEVFSALASVLGRLPVGGPLSVRIEPPRMRGVERWLERAMLSAKNPTPEEIAGQLLRPLLAQVRLDAGSLVADLAEHRLGLQGAETSVREEADRLGLTRARVYQLLADVADIMRLRWPAGAAMVHELSHNLPTEPEHAREYDQFFTAVELLFPTRLGPGRGARAATANQAMKCAS